MSHRFYVLVNWPLLFFNFEGQSFNSRVQYQQKEASLLNYLRVIPVTSVSTPGFTFTFHRPLIGAQPGGWLNLSVALPSSCKSWSCTCNCGCPCSCNCTQNAACTGSSLQTGQASCSAGANYCISDEEYSLQHPFVCTCTVLNYQLNFLENT